MIIELNRAMPLNIGKRREMEMGGDSRGRGVSLFEESPILLIERLAWWLQADNATYLSSAKYLFPINFLYLSSRLVDTFILNFKYIKYILHTRGRNFWWGSNSAAETELAIYRVNFWVKGLNSWYSEWYTIQIKRYCDNQKTLE